MNIDNPLITISMNIILDSGDARTLANQALNAAKEQKWELANGLMEKARKKIVSAHVSQTKVIQDEMNGKEFEQCALFNHAQDTLMVINSELNMIANMIDIYIELHKIHNL